MTGLEEWRVFIVLRDTTREQNRETAWSGLGLRMASGGKRAHRKTTRRGQSGGKCSTCALSGPRARRAVQPRAAEVKEILGPTDAPSPAGRSRYRVAWRLTQTGGQTKRIRDPRHLLEEHDARARVDRPLADGGPRIARRVDVPRKDLHQCVFLRGEVRRPLTDPRGPAEVQPRLRHDRGSRTWGPQTDNGRLERAGMEGDGGPGCRPGRIPVKAAPQSRAAGRRGRTGAWSSWTADAASQRRRTHPRGIRD